MAHAAAEARALALLKARAAGGASYERPSGADLLAAFRAFDAAGAGVVERTKLRASLLAPTLPGGAMSEAAADELLARLAPVEDEDGVPPRARYDLYVALAQREK